MGATVLSDAGWSGSCLTLAVLSEASVGSEEESGLFTSSATGVVGPDCFAGGKRGLPRAGERFDGRVLLRCTPELGVEANAGVMGLGTAPEWRERFDEVETFLRTPPYIRKLSAPALEDVDADRPMPELLRPGVVGVLAWGVGG